MVITAAILAGGRATRFGGHDKSALIVDGRSMLDRQVDELSRLTSDVIIVGRDAPYGHVRAVPDRTPGCGPLGGLQTALAESRGEVTIVVACDMPYLSAPFLAHLAALTPEADAVVPETERGYHPLCAAYTQACLEPVTRRLSGGRFKMTDVFADVRLRVVAGEEIERFGDRHRLLANVNTPTEYRGLEALLGHEL